MNQSKVTQIQVKINGKIVAWLQITSAYGKFRLPAGRQA